MENRLNENSNLSKVRLDNEVYTKFGNTLKPREGSGKAFEPVTNCNGPFKQVEQLPSFARMFAMLLQIQVNPNHLGEGMNDGDAETVKQIMIACFEDNKVGYLPEEELPMLKQIRNAIDKRIGKVENQIRSKDRRLVYQPVTKSLNR